jgi:multidrug transporter EmrE-like cation transporter
LIFIKPALAGKGETEMTKNVGGIDRILRIVVGLVLIAYALNLIAPDTGYNIWGWIGVVPLVTALVNFCPLYKIIGLSTSKEA